MTTPFPTGVPTSVGTPSEHVTPGTYRGGGAGFVIRYNVLPSTLGRVLVAATPAGVCAISLGDEDAVLEAELREEFFNAASVERDDPAIEAWADSVVSYLDGVHAHPIAPVQLQGTAFQQCVWRALQEIPSGETRSYREIADLLGRPSAVRAVAGACARNKVALIVPCHRVVRTDGGLGGYRWGVERKRQLLDLERQMRGGSVERTPGVTA